MYQVQNIIDLKLAPGDEVAAVVSHRGCVLVFTKLGQVIRVEQVE